MAGQARRKARARHHAKAPHAAEGALVNGEVMSLADGHAEHIFVALVREARSAAMPGEAVAMSAGASLLANAAKHMASGGCADPDCKSCVPLLGADFRRTAHQVLDLHLDRAELRYAKPGGRA